MRFFLIWKKKTAWLMALPAGLILVFAVLLYNPVRTLSSLQKVDEHLYIMTYQGDYGFDKFLETGIQASPYAASHPIDNADWACSCFATSNREGKPEFGRNFDWSTNTALLLFTDPPNGYASVSMLDVSYLGFLSGSVELNSLDHALSILDAPYLPFDGMNEYGLAVGLMAVPYAQGGNDPQKSTIGSLHAIRLILDHAKNVAEAVALLQDYNIDFSGGPPVHYLVADPAGNSAVVEFLEDKMSIVRNTEPWQVATNFILSGKTPEQALSSCWRYKAAYEVLDQNEGLLSQNEAMTLLDNISQANTRWSVTYGMVSGDIQVVMQRDYEHILQFKLEMQTAPGW